MSTLMLDSPDGLPSTGLLRTAYNVLAARILASVVSGTEFDDLRPSHRNAMEQLEIEDGLRLTDLAIRAGITAQSMGELVDDLESKRYVERRPDPADRRAKRIHLTERGRENARMAKHATAEVEDHRLRILGQQRYQLLRSALEDIIAAEDRSDR